MNPNFSPRFIDMHLHLGLERRQSAERAYKEARQNSVTHLGVMDHAELYFENPPDWAHDVLIDAKKRNRRNPELDLHDEIELHTKGPHIFLERAKRERTEFGEGMNVLIGLEIGGRNIAQVNPKWLECFDYVGLCTSQQINDEAWGESIALQVRAMHELIKNYEGNRRKMGFVVHHPFRWRLMELHADGEMQTQFTRDDAAIAAEAIIEAEAIAELNFTSWSWLRARGELERLSAGLNYLADLDVKFSVGSDYHSLHWTKEDYDPTLMLSDFNLAEEDIRLPVL